MLTPFDWLRRCQNGTELLATLTLLHEIGAPELPLASAPAEPPYGALAGPCLRCWIYPRAEDRAYCPFCASVLDEAHKNGAIIRRVLVVWGYANCIPTLDQERILGHYVLDEQRFLLMLPRQAVKPWLQDLLLEAGLEMRGLLQIFPTQGAGHTIGMGDILCRAIHHEANLPRAHLWIRFYSAPYQLVNPRRRSDEGILSFEASEFLRLLDMAEIFRALLRPEQQRALHDLLAVEDVEEQAFHWGRFTRQLDQRAHDMLASWQVRHWPPNKVKLLYELIDYVLPPGIH